MPGRLPHYYRPEISQKRHDEIKIFLETTPLSIVQNSAVRPNDRGLVRRYWLGNTFCIELQTINDRYFIQYALFAGRMVYAITFSEFFEELSPEQKKAFSYNLDLFT